MDNISALLWSVLFGGIGLGFFTYGKRQRAVVPLVVGIALFVLPYVIPNEYLMVGTGGVLMAVPYFVRL